MKFSDLLNSKYSTMCQELGNLQCNRDRIDEQNLKLKAKINVLDEMAPELNGMADAVLAKNVIPIKPPNDKDEGDPNVT